MELTLRDYVLFVSQSAILEESVMYYDIEHKNIHYSDGTNLKDRLQDKDNHSNQNTSLVDIAIVDLAIAY